jgi:hypothetical protein
MPAVQERSDAADRCSPGERRNRRMGQLMSDAISHARAGRGFPVAPVCMEVCLDPVAGTARDGCIAPETPFSSASRIAKHLLRASPLSIPSNRRYFLGLLCNTVSFQNT